MYLRKLYVRTRLFLYSKRKITNAIVVAIMITILAYLFVNFFIFERLILGKAQESELNGKYNSAITFYNIAYPYYKINHYSQQNKDIYLKIPYELSTCYLNKNNKTKALESIYTGMDSVKKEYGDFSHENANYVRKYLIQYYLENNELKLAKKTFSNLLAIYKKIGCSDAEVADLTRIKGDIYYQQKDYDFAVELYKRAYDASPFDANTDYEIFSKIIYRIGEYEIANGKTEEAISVYRNALTVLKNSGERQSALSADMLLKLGDIYANNDLSVKDAIICYEKAVEIIQKLPHISPLRQNRQAYMTTLRDLYNKDSQYQKANAIDAEILKQRRFSFLF